MSPAEASLRIDRWIAHNPPPPDWPRSALEWAWLEMFLWPWQGEVKRVLERRLLVEQLLRKPA